MNKLAEGIGASAEAIQYHYDFSNEFYKEWLDQTMTYSSALWLDGIEKRDLYNAQLAKLRWHIESAGLEKGGRLLDIGCGWGSLIDQHLSSDENASAVGLTLSDAQADYIESKNLNNVDIIRQSWADHQPQEKYDGIISIGAFEHFAKPGITSDHKIVVYREFFEKCRSFLKKGGQLSLQTIAYGNLTEENKNLFTQNEIFPDSELPRPFEVLAACDSIFEVETFRNDRRDYARTCDLWLENLKNKKDIVVKNYGEQAYLKYEKYLKLVSVGFYLGQMYLLRFKLKAI